MGLNCFPVPPEMNCEENRLKSFDQWKVTFVKKEHLAQLGFFYVGVADIVKCFFCNIEIGAWKQSDDALIEHMKFNRQCDLICRRPTTNVPLCAASLDLRLPPPIQPSNIVDHCLEKLDNIVEEVFEESPLEPLEHEKIKNYLRMFGYKLVKIE